MTTDTRPLTAEQLQRLRELEREATPAPWQPYLEAAAYEAAYVYASEPRYTPGNASPAKVAVKVAWLPAAPCGDRPERDARLIAEMRNAAPALIAAADGCCAEWDAHAARVTQLHAQLGNVERECNDALARMVTAEQNARGWEERATEYARDALAKTQTINDLNWQLAGAEDAHEQATYAARAAITALEATVARLQSALDDAISAGARHRPLRKAARAAVLDGAASSGGMEPSSGGMREADR